MLLMPAAGHAVDLGSSGYYSPLFFDYMERFMLLYRQEGQQAGAALPVEPPEPGDSRTGTNGKE